VINWQVRLWIGHQLVQACAERGSAVDWEEFMRRYHSLLTAAAIRVSRQWGQGASDEIDDIVQEIYLRMCADRARVLTSFRDSRPEAIFGYLKVTATNIAHDFFRHRSALKRGAERTKSFEEIGPVPAEFNDLDRRLTLGEINEMLLVHTQKENGPRDRTVFRLYYRYGMTAHAIAGLPGIGLNSKGVEGVLHRLTKAIRQAMGEVQETSTE
jgi:RNA polymerase sigma-70 factor (ECF subfamily)